MNIERLRGESAPEADAVVVDSLVLCITGEILFTSGLVRNDYRISSEYAFGGGAGSTRFK